MIKPYRVYVRGKEKVTFLGCYKTIEAAKKRIDASKKAYKKNGFNGVLWIDYKGDDHEDVKGIDDDA